MHTMHMLSTALGLARDTGYRIREEPLDGAGGGHCLIQGQPWLLLDLTQSAQEQLDVVLDALQAQPQLEWAKIPPELAEQLRAPRAA